MSDLCGRVLAIEMSDDRVDEKFVPAEALTGMKGFDRVELVAGTTYKDASTVFIVPSRDPSVHFRVFHTWQSMISPMNQKKHFIFRHGDEVGRAYNQTIKDVLGHPELSTWKYVMTMETDNLQPPDAHIKLIETIEAGRYDGVSGIYFTKGDLNMPMAYGDPAEYARTGILDFRPRDIREALTSGQVMEVNGIACGCSLYRMDLFKEIEPDWFVTLNDYYDGKGVALMTQDLYFCQKARMKGKRFAVDMRVKVGHLDLATGIVY